MAVVDWVPGRVLTSSTPSAWSMVQRGERRLLAARKTRMNSTLCPDRLTLEPLASKGNETIDMFLAVPVRVRL